MIRESLIAIGLAVLSLRAADAAPPTLAPQPPPAAAAAAKTAAATPPTSAPTTATSAPARYGLVIPPGFKKIEVNQRAAVLEPVDEAWVRQTLEAVQPTTMPTTMPSDLL